MWTHGFAEHVSNNKCLYLSFIIGHGLSAESQQQKWGIGHSLSSFVIKLEVLKICCLEEVSLQEMQDITQSSFSKKFQTRMTRWLLLLLISFNPFLTLSHIDFFAPPADSEASDDDVMLPSSDIHILLSGSIRMIRRIQAKAFQTPSSFFPVSDESSEMSGTSTHCDVKCWRDVKRVSEVWNCWNRTVKFKTNNQKRKKTKTWGSFLTSSIRNFPHLKIRGRYIPHLQRFHNAWYNYMNSIL